MHKNKINGKVYIGQTKQRLEHRWDNGNGYVSCTYFYKAIQKYGWDNFEHKVLKEHLSKEEADFEEISLIAYYNSNNPKYGYNISAGGAGNPVIKYKNIYKYDLDGNFVCKINDITEIPKSQQPAVRQCCDEKIHYAYGYQWKLYHMDKIEPIRSRGELHASNMVYQYDVCGNFINRYPSIKIAAEENHIGVSGISKCCRKKQKTYQGFQWSYNYKDKIEPIEILYIYKFDLAGKYVERFISINEASRITKIRNSSISNCISGNIDTAGGFIWRRLPENYDITQPIKFEHRKWTAVVLIDNKGNDIKKYVSISSAAKDLDINDPSAISKVCKGISKTVQGYRFRYA